MGPPRPATSLDVEHCLAGSGAVTAAAEVGVLDQLAERPSTVSEVARGLGLDTRLVELLLDALDVVGAVESGEDGRYRALVTADRVRQSTSLWATLPDALSSGQGPVDVSRQLPDGEGYQSVVRHIAGLTEPLHVQVTELLGGIGPRVLDLGAGAAPWTRALAARDPALHVTAVDRADVLAVTREVVEANGLGDRFSYLDGDLFEADLGGPYDLVVLAGVCRLFAPRRVADLLGRIEPAMAPGATLAILDALPDVDRADSGSNSLYALNLALRTSEGGLHPFSSYASWLFAAGLVDIDLTLLDLPEMSLIRAIRPV